MAISEEWSPLELKFLVDKCLNEGWKTFGCRKDVWQCTQDDFVSMANKCSKLRELGMGFNASKMQSWPMLTSPWTSLQSITICSTNLGGIFEGVELHLTLPNLVRIFLQEIGREGNTEPSFLPDLEGCDKLEFAMFNHGFFRFNGDVLPGDELPLPPGLITLNLMGSRFHEEFMNRIKEEEIKRLLPGLQNFGPRDPSVSPRTARLADGTEVTGFAML